MGYSAAAGFRPQTSNSAKGFAAVAGRLRLLAGDQPGVTTMSSSIGKQAVVVGAGIAGLVAARVLADHFDRVVVLERDTLPGVPDHRPGTPQSRFTHGLMAGGMQALRGLFPGLERHLIDAGSIILDMGLDVRNERPGYDPFPQRKTGVVTYCASRPLIEHCVRTSTRQHAKNVYRVYSRSAGGETLRRPRTAAAVTGVPERGRRTWDPNHCLRSRRRCQRTRGADVRFAEIPGSTRHPWRARSGWTWATPRSASPSPTMRPPNGRRLRQRLRRRTVRVPPGCARSKVGNGCSTLLGMRGDKPPGDWCGRAGFPAGTPCIAGRSMTPLHVPSARTASIALHCPPA